MILAGGWSQPILADPAGVSFSQSAAVIEANDFVEITVEAATPDAKNPFVDVAVGGHFGEAGQGQPVAVQGFCDSPDGRLFRIRFMPTRPGSYTYEVSYRQGGFRTRHVGTFAAAAGKRRGLLRVDAAYPWHFVWQGTGEHYYLNGTTAFLLMGWEDEQTIRDSIDRLHRLKVNRMRVLLAGRSGQFWSEPIKPGHGFSACLNPWAAERPEDVFKPGFDYRRFNLPYWQKYERMLRYARDEDMIISVIMDWNDSKVHPRAGSADEYRYYRYAVARLAAFSNVTWDLGDDLNLYRSARWTHRTGTLLKQWDPYRHLATSHPANNKYQDRASGWFDMTSFQRWERPVHGWMLAQREEQVKAGRIIPQVNEEYGYEDHYPNWSPEAPPAYSADNDRRAAWEMAMAGTYQTTGETAKRGTGVPPDTGGGWVNGRGDETMKMLDGYGHMVDFFTAFEWWKALPHDDLTSAGTFCLAEPGKLYALYLPHGGAVTVRLEPGLYEATWFDPRTGKTTQAGRSAGPVWTAPSDPGDWALLLKRAGAAH